MTKARVLASFGGASGPLTRGQVTFDQYESALQRQVVETLDWSLPHDAIILVIPGGDGRATRAPGYKDGSPDTFIVYRARVIFLELKKLKGGKLSDDQIKMHARLTACGAIVLVGRTLEQVMDQLRVLVPLKGRVSA